jgi:hypothetical protein
MLERDCQPYRGLRVRVHIRERDDFSFNGMGRRYSVTWFLQQEGIPASANIVASFTEPLDFWCPDEAASFTERRACTFADGAMMEVEKTALAPIGRT